MQKVQPAGAKDGSDTKSGQDTGFGEHPVKSVPAWSCKQQTPPGYTCSVQGVLTQQPAHTPVLKTQRVGSLLNSESAQQPPKCHLLEASQQSKTRSGQKGVAGIPRDEASVTYR